MKKLNFILISFALLALTGCEEDSNMDPVGAWTLSAPSLQSPADNESIVLNVNQNQEEFEFSWAPASSSEGYNVSYRFTLIYATTDTLYSVETDELSTSLNAQEFDGFLADAGVASEAVTALAWIVTSLSLDKATDSGSRTINVMRFEDTGPPSTLYVVGNGVSAGSLNLVGSVYESNNYFALQEGVTYSFSPSPTGGGISYGLTTAIGATTTPNGDKINATTSLTEGGTFTAARDQMYTISVDVDNLSVDWLYYNLKLFHWDEDNGGWDARTENLMTYVHPHSFTRSVQLVSQYHSKFFSPWDIQFGSDTPTQLVGTMTENPSGANWNNISTTGMYTVTINVNPDYSGGVYDFELQ